MGSAVVGGSATRTLSSVSTSTDQTSTQAAAGILTDVDETPRAAPAGPWAVKTSVAPGCGGSAHRSLQRAGPKIQLVVALILVLSVMLIVAAALIAELTAPGVRLTY